MDGKDVSLSRSSGLLAADSVTHVNSFKFVFGSFYFYCPFTNYLYEGCHRAAHCAFDKKKLLLQRSAICSAPAERYDEVIFCRTEFIDLMDVSFSQRMTPLPHPGSLGLFFHAKKMLSINAMISTPAKVITTRVKPPGERQSDWLTVWLTDRYSFYICDSHPDRTRGPAARDYIHNWNYLPKMHHLFCDAAIPGHLLKGWRMHLHLMVRGPLALTSAAHWGKKKISVSAVKDFSNDVASTKVSRVLKKHANTFV